MRWYAMVHTSLTIESGVIWIRIYGIQYLHTHILKSQNTHSHIDTTTCMIYKYDLRLNEADPSIERLLISRS